AAAWPTPRRPRPRAISRAHVPRHGRDGRARARRGPRARRARRARLPRLPLTKSGVEMMFGVNHLGHFLAAASGGYFVESRRAPPSPAARDDALAARLWDESERLARL